LEHSAQYLSNANFAAGAPAGAEQGTGAGLVFLVALCTIGLFAAAFIGILFRATPVVLIPTGFCLLAAAMLLVRSAAMQHFGTTKILCVLFFALATLHVVVGFLLAGLTTTHTSIRSNEDVYYANSLLINSVGLFAAALGYTWKMTSSGRRAQTGFHPSFLVFVNSNIAEQLFRLLASAGAVTMFYVYWRLGFLDYLANPAKWPFFRYITSDLAGGSATDEWFANRAMDFLTVSLPFLVYRVVKTRHSWLLNISLITTGYIALLLPLRRANLLGVLFASLILIGIGRRDMYRLTRRWLIIIGCLYVFSQCLFLLGVLSDDFNPQAVLTVSSTALPEVRDLAWTLNRLNGEQLNGVTFAQALVPLPSIASDWSAQHSLRAVTTKLIGVDQTGESGGLRLTLMGEGFINFGYLGTIAVSFLWGLGVAWCERLLHATQNAPSEFMNYVAVMCFVWICFLIYLAGTQAAASVKMGAILLLAVAWLSKYRSRLVSAPAEASA
jgi:hypothetical protein